MGLDTTGLPYRMPSNDCYYGSSYGSLVVAGLEVGLS